MSFPSNLISAFVTLFVTIGPIETAAIFAGITASNTAGDRKRLAARGVLIAGGVLLLFAVGGGAVLGAMHVSLPAFRVAGGLLLFLQALTLTFASPGLSSLSAGEQREAREATDIAVFPLAFPLIAGPGALSAIVLLMGQGARWTDEAGVILMLLACLAITYIFLRISERLVHWLGKTGADVVGRISGILLAALAVQFVFDGIRQAGLWGG